MVLESAAPRKGKPGIQSEENMPHTNVLFQGRLHFYKSNRVHISLTKDAAASSAKRKRNEQGMPPPHVLRLLRFHVLSTLSCYYYSRCFLFMFSRSSFPMSNFILGCLE